MLVAPAIGIAYSSVEFNEWPRWNSLTRFERRWVPTHGSGTEMTGSGLLMVGGGFCSEFRFVGWLS